jgi:hypothetical protein
LRRSSGGTIRAVLETELFAQPGRPEKFGFEDVLCIGLSLRRKRAKGWTKGASPSAAFFER